MEEKNEKDEGKNGLLPGVPGERKKRGRSRKRAEGPEKTKTVRIAAGAAVLAVFLLAAGGGFFLFQMKKYTAAFFPNTVINGADASGKTVDQVKAVITDRLSGYTIRILGRSGTGGTVTGEEIGLHPEFDGALEELLGKQEPAEWIRYWKEGPEYQTDTLIVFDEERLAAVLKELPFMEPGEMKEPENAKISGYDSGSRSYSVVPAVPGTVLDEKKVRDAVETAIRNMEDQVDLDAEGCYAPPAVDETDGALNEAVALLNTYAGAVVTHTFGDKKEVLDGDTISQWITVDGTTVTLDESQAAAYVKGLAEKYDTAYQPKTLKTSYGPSVTITRGHYGWKISQTAETAAVLEIIRNGEQQTREPEYSQKAASRGENDYGNTYVEINLTAQHLYFYKDGEILVEADFVSGNESRGWSTPGGAYPLTYKQRNATLRGEGYATPVSYWMPFNGGIGLHDAGWRGSFGGSIYKTNGSHGCVNLPPKAAKTIYENISQGDPVLCYHLAGTESKKPGTVEKPAETTTAAPPETPAPTVTETPAPAETTPAETAPVPVGPSVELPGENNNGPGGTGDSGGPGGGPYGPGGTDGPGGNSGGPGGTGDPTAPAGPGGGTNGPGGTPVAPVETAPVLPGSGQPVPPVTAGGDEEHFGPGFADPGPEDAAPQVGPGM